MLYLFLENNSGICPNDTKGWHRTVSEEMIENKRVALCSCGASVKLPYLEHEWMWKANMAQRDYLKEVAH